MSMMKNSELVRTYIEEAFNKGNINAVDRFLSPAFLDHNPFSPQQALGPAGQKQMISRFHEAFANLHITLESVISEGDIVAARGTYSGMQKGSFMGVPPTGKRVSWQAMAFFRVANGKIAERWSNHDLLGLLQQLGLIPERIEVPAVR